MTVPKKNTNGRYCVLAFAFGTLLFLLSALPFAAANGWRFYFYGDFNAQQIPFTLYIHDCLRSFYIPDFDFNAGTGLDFLNAYSFYNLFSPFTLLFALVPTRAAGLAIPFAISVKFGFCALTAYLYISRFCRNGNLAVAGALLYTFSGYQTVNFLFHYLDAAALFPLLLYALEISVTEKKRGVFGITAAVCALTNYYIFGIEVIFIVIYFLFRLTDSSFRIGAGDFFCLAAESVLGVMAAGIVLIPAAVCLMNSPRFGEPFDGLTDMLFYETPWRYPRILQSIFIAPDLQGYTNFFPDYNGAYPQGSKWSSQAMYLPMFGMSGVIAYILSNKKQWQTKLAAACTVIAFVPFLNGIFSLGSSVYYARWMLAPTLIMSAMTVCALENENSRPAFRTGAAVNSAVLLAVLIFCIAFPMEKLSLWSTVAYYSNVQKWIQLVMTALGLAAVLAAVPKTKTDGSFPQKMLALTAAFAFALCETSILFGMGETRYPQAVDAVYSDYPEFEKTEYGRRIAADDAFENYNLVWGIGSMHTFNSAVNPYFSEYCDSLGIYREDIMTHYPSECLLSVKEYAGFNPFAEESSAESLKSRLPHDLSEMYTLSGVRGIYAIFENNNFIPMGFCYDYCISKEDFLALDGDIRDTLMLKAMVVEELSEVSDYLTPLNSEDIRALTGEELSAECAKRAETSAYSYTSDGKGYTAEILLDEQKPVFFSVAYDEGFTAFVDGENAKLLRANIGFQAVVVPAGRHTVRVEYHSKWRDIGLAASLLGSCGLAVYILILRARRKQT